MLDNDAPKFHSSPGKTWQCRCVERVMQYRVLALLLLWTSQLGCGLGVALLSDEARNKFSRQHSCPKERLVINVAPLKARALLTIGPPPPEIAADPGRLAVWRSTAREDIAGYGDMTAIRVRGCGLEQTYLCWDERASYGDDLNFICEEFDFTEANLRFGSFTLNSRVVESLREQLFP